MVDEKLIEIRKQFEVLNTLINEFLDSQKQDRIVLKRDDFKLIKYLGFTYNMRILDYNDGCIFHLRDDNVYHKEHYDKLMNGTLERLIINRRDNIFIRDNYKINYELESVERTKLNDLYRPE